MKKSYIKPLITLIYLDKSITLMMLSSGDPRTGTTKSTKKETDDPFASPFGDKPFN
jgi:hypothetical protein